MLHVDVHDLFLGGKSSSVESSVATRRLLGSGTDKGRDVRNPTREQIRRLRVPEEAVPLWLEALHVQLQTLRLVVK